MEAFVPCGAPLKSSRNFVTGNAIISQKRSGITGRNIDEASVEISSIKLPAIPNIGFGKKSQQPETPVSVNKSASKETPKTLSIGGRTVVSQPGTGKKATTISSALQRGLPKFYNGTTARHRFAAAAIGQGATAYDARKGERGVKPVNVRDNDQGGFRNMDLYTDSLLWARPDWSSDEARVAVNVALRNVFGNANIFESELEELASNISCVTKTGDMREFVRALGLSNAYRKRFFEPCSNMRFVELNFKHFLGRAPHNQAEISAQIRTLTEEGYNAAINAMIDSEEYDRLFGRSRLPMVNFRGGHPYNNDMNKTAILNASFVSSDRLNKKAILQTGDSAGFAPFSVLKGLPEAWRGENTAREAAGPLMNFPDTLFWNMAPPELQKAELDWNMRYGSWTKFWYKNSLPREQVMTPVLTHSDQEEAEAAAALKYGSLMGKMYVGSRKLYDMAPIINVQPAANLQTTGGTVSVRMDTIAPAIPAELVQDV